MLEVPKSQISSLNFRPFRTSFLLACDVFREWDSLPTPKITHSPEAINYSFSHICVILMDCFLVEASQDFIVMTEQSNVVSWTS